MGRPRKNPTDVKTDGIKVLFTSEELARLHVFHESMNKKLPFSVFLSDMIDKGIASEQEKKAENSFLEERGQAAK